MIDNPQPMMIDTTGNGQARAPILAYKKQLESPVSDQRFDQKTEADSESSYSDLSAKKLPHV